MAKFYPRMQTALIFMVSLTTVTAFAYYVKSKNVQVAELSNLAKGNVAAVLDTQNLTSTSTDWQKQFLTGDKKIGNQNNSTSQKTQKKQTLSDKIGLELFTQYWQLHQAGLDDDKEALNTVISRFSDQIAAVAAPTIYTTGDIKIVDDSPSTNYTYAKGVLLALKKIPSGDAATIANDALSKEDPNLLTKIDPLIVGYKASLDALRNIKVPIGFSRNHLALVNAVSGLYFTAESLRKVNADPVKGMAAVSIYVSSLQQLSDALSNLQNNFTNAGIVFVDSTNKN